MSAQNKNKNEIVITHTFNAPLELAWRAWSEPEDLMRWVSPKNFTCPVCKVDFRIGGKYLYCFRSAEGQNYWSTGTYREIIPIERIVSTDNFADENGNIVPASQYGLTGEWPSEVLVTVIFKEQNGGTKLTLHHAGIPDGEMIELCTQGWNESFDKLEELLHEPQMKN